MPRGTDAFRRHQEAVERRREEAQSTFGPKADYFGLSSGEGAVVRFLEQGQDLAYASCHRVPVPGREFPQEYICLDQNDDGTPCPGCQSDYRGIRARTTKGFINLIWRGGPQLQAINQQRVAAGQPQFTLGPVYKRNEFGSPEKIETPGGRKQSVVLGYADGLFLWKCSKNVFELLVGKDSAFRGLMSRDFVVSRQGAGKEDTKYFVEPFDVDGGPQEMLVADLQLAARKYDLDAFTVPSTYEALAMVLSGTAPTPGPQPTFDRGAGGGFAPASQPQPGGTVFDGAPPMRSSAFTRAQ